MNQNFPPLLFSNAMENMAFGKKISEDFSGGLPFINKILPTSGKIEMKFQKTN